MRKTGDVSGFTLSDLVMPVAIILLVTCAVGYSYSRKMQKEYESRTTLLTREIFDCEPEELLADINKPQPKRENVARKVPEAPSLDCAQEPTTQKLPTFAQHVVDAEKKAAKRKAQNSPPRKRNRAAIAGKTARQQVTQPPAMRRAFRHPQVIADAHTARCEAILNDMR